MASGPGEYRIPLSTLAILVLLAVLLLGSPFGTARAQDLEPRRWTHLPVGLNVLGVGAGWTDGEILFDPVLLIEDASLDLYVAGLGYTRAFDLFGKTARLDVNVPYASGRWEGLLNGQYTVVRRTGFADPSLRFSVNLYGAPALKGDAFLAYRRDHPVSTTVGAAISVIAPLGEYFSDKLINLGGNRWVVRPQLGVLHQHGRWQFELTGSVFLYQTNHEFLQTSVREQDPLYFMQAHAIRAFRKGWWSSFSAGFAYGGQSKINGLLKPDDARSRYFALSLGMPVGRRQSVKLTYLTADTNISVGQNTDTLLVGWSVNWSR